MAARHKQAFLDFDKNQAEEAAANKEGEKPASVTPAEPEQETEAESTPDAVPNET